MIRVRFIRPDKGRNIVAKATFRLNAISSSQ
jgi:hypothetical protein